MYSDTGDVDSWTEGFEDGYDLPEKYHVPYFDHRGQRELINYWKSGIPYAVVEISGQEKKSFDNRYFYHTDFVKVPEATKQLMMQQEQVTFSMAYMKHGALTWTPSPISEQQSILLQRFAKVFEQTYTRFLDLQKAEAQAREAQIAVAMERVRARAMAMHSSNELDEVVHELRKQMGVLGQKNLETCVIHLHDVSPDFIYSWAAIKPPETDSEIVETTAKIPKKGLLIIEEALEAYTANRQDYIIINKGKKLNQWFSFLKKESPQSYHKLMESANGNTDNLQAFWSFADFAGGSLLMVTMDEPDEITRGLLRRFTNVFGLAYRRFADLKQAEAQAREAQIEAALERVRSKTMAMHSSREVGESVATLFDELSAMKLLGSSDRCGIGIMQPHEIMELWTAEKTEGGKTELTIGFLDMKPHPLLRSAYNGWIEKKVVNQYILEGEDKIEYYRAMQNQTRYKIKKDYYTGPEKIVHTDFYFNEGVLYVFSQHEFEDESEAVFTRFANVFGQTYRRYLDLKKAEAQAREAQIEAALEKVRSRTMAMQSSEELADAAYVLFEQLNMLGVTHERINIGIVNETQQTIDFWVTEQGGEKLSTKFSGRISEPTTLSKTYQAWKKGEKSMMVDLKGEDLKSWLKYINEEIKIPFNRAFLHNRRVQTAGFFSKGMLVVTSPEPLQEEALYLLEKFAGVFDLTYTRFSDLKIAEAHALQAREDLIAIKEAKQKAEIALTELQATQKQLIQAEKMASLGELTAGIAHEIQNPLNFVNNFSEVNSELIEELKAESLKPNAERDEKLEVELLHDISENEKKINHHGKRAGEIVRSMLQHSRSSTGQKELTDMNALCDEYLRLAYHGLRAKDKSFNAKFETHLDPTLQKVNVVPQDIGRVILNLINNAFYAVSEKAKLQASGYEPQVIVSTKKVGDKVEISVKDNGSGIPDSIKDKIFQPFFTTKPTGQGTGLGLSLSYDIVKAHGGEFRMETKEGEGTNFTIFFTNTPTK
jgi:signal transduction histidine kinase